MTPTTSESALRRTLNIIRDLPLDRAEALAGRMLRDNPSSDVAHFALGVASRRSDRIELAIGSLRNAGRINRDSAIIARVLGETYLIDNEPGLARIAFRASLERAPRDVEASVGLAVCHAHIGGTIEAKSILRRVLVVRPSHAIASLYMGLMLAADGDHEGALPWLETSVAQRPGSASAGLQLGKCRAALGDIAGAEEAFLAVLSHSPDDSKARQSLRELIEPY